MKKRNGFVSNSSSSSFIIAKKDLTSDQILAITYHEESDYWKSHVAERFSGLTNIDIWNIYEDNEVLTGSTSMDNFSMIEYFEIIGVKVKLAKWGDQHENQTWFCSNSSSTAFIITNKISEELTMVDFTKEKLVLLEQFDFRYDHDFTEKDFLESSEWEDN